MPQHIEPLPHQVLAQRPAESYLRCLRREPVIDPLVHYLAEINRVHLFRDGNRHAQRAFIGQLAQQAGYRIAWSRLDPH